MELPSSVELTFPFSNEVTVIFPIISEYRHIIIRLHLLGGCAGSLKQQKERFTFNAADRIASFYNHHMQIRRIVSALGSMVKSYSIWFVPVFVVVVKPNLGT